MGHVAAAARQRNQPPARVKAEWEKDGRLDSERWSLRQDKVLDFLVSKAAIRNVEKLGEPAGDAPTSGGQISTSPEPAEDGHVHGPDCDH